MIIITIESAIVLLLSIAITSRRKRRISYPRDFWIFIGFSEFSSYSKFFTLLYKGTLRSLSAIFWGYLWVPVCYYLKVSLGTTYYILGTPSDPYVLYVVVPLSSNVLLSRGTLRFSYPVKSPLQDTSPLYNRCTFGIDWQLKAIGFQTYY
jgi:hypothetical protein